MLEAPVWVETDLFGVLAIIYVEILNQICKSLAIAK